jgi:SAM-dependent methyltransferase
LAFNGAFEANGGTAVAFRPTHIITTMTSLRLELRWQSAAVSHCDTLALPPTALPLDALGRQISDALCQVSAGVRIEQSFQPGELIAAHDPDRLQRLRPEQFHWRAVSPVPIHPAPGRFYPAGLFTGVEHPPASTQAPARVVGVANDHLLVDLNHPLAGRPLEIVVENDTGLPGAADRAPQTASLGALLTNGGPGMQGRWQGKPTAFLVHGALRRNDDDDAGFYAQPRLVDHLDRTALSALSALYARLIPRGSRILDLMSSWHSHLPASLEPATVVGLGMNADELARNPVLARRVVRDLNIDPTLPFPDASFDALICTVSVEYLTAPFAVFNEIARVLKPGGIAVMTFSNRCFPTKAVHIWQQLHEFERMGLVLEYFRESGRFGDLSTWSLRGLCRPPEDRYSPRLQRADPLYAVWGRRLV